jgi:hypothetical protein
VIGIANSMGKLMMTETADTASGFKISKELLKIII